MSLIVTGSIGLDTVHTPTGSARNILGGSCTYFAAAASFFGPVRIVAAVGDDFPDQHMRAFEHFGIDTLGLERRAGSRTFSWTGKYLPNMNDRETLEVQPNVLAEDLPPVPESYRDSRYVFLANTHPEGQMALLDQFPNRTLAVADTMDLWIETARPQLENLIAKIDGLVLNDSEARLLTGESNMVAASTKILDMGPTFVVVKKGEHGCLLRHRDGLGILHAYPALHVVDPTGAGDSFAGGMMGHLASIDDTSLGALRVAIAKGTIVASYTIESFILQRLQEIDRKDIEGRLAEYRSMLLFEEA